MCFLAAARDGFSISKAGDSRIRSYIYGTLCDLPSDYVSLIDSFHLFHVVRASGLDAARSLLAFKWTNEVYWSPFFNKRPLLYYEFHSVEVMGIPYSSSVKKKRKTSGKLVDSSVKLPSVDVLWLPLDNFQTLYYAMTQATAYFVKVYGDIVSPHSKYLACYTHDEGELYILINEDARDLEDLVTSGQVV